MLRTLIDRMSEKGYIIRVVSADCIRDILDEIDKLGLYNLLDKNFYWFLKDYYKSRAKDISFEVKSVIIAASSCKMAKIYMSRNGKRIPLILPPTYIEYAEAPLLIENCLKNILLQGGYHASKTSDLPAKIIASRCGLAEYGRNNITYVRGMGSFVLLSTYYSDLPCQTYQWKDMELMEMCNNCNACIQNCPTAALTQERYLVKARRCITFLNEFDDSSSFPEWVKPNSHNSIVGCMRCQVCCPANKNFLKPVESLVEFGEEETTMLLAGCDIHELPITTVKKLKSVNLMAYYDKLSRNIKVLLSDML